MSSASWKTRFSFQPCIDELEPRQLLTGTVLQEPLANFELDEGSGLVADGGDVSGSIHQASWVAGHTGSALSFDGVDDHVDLGTPDVVSDVAASGGLTISAWIRLSSVGDAGEAEIISKAAGSGEQDQFWSLAAVGAGGQSRLQFQLKTGADPASGTTTLVASAGNLQANTWHLAVATYDGATMRLYLDGLEVGSTAKTGEVANQGDVSAWIGGNPGDPTGKTWDGLIDEVRLYNRPLSVSEVQQLQAGNIAPSIQDQTFALAENSAAGTLVGTIIAGDADGDTLNYTITAGNQAGVFVIDSATGEIRVASDAVLDFEATPSLGLTVQTSDGQATSSATVTINLSDVNEAPQISDQSFYVNPGPGEAESQPLLHAQDLQYVGAFRVPSGNIGSSTFSYGGTALAYNAANNSLFLVGHTHQQQIAEISIPTQIVSSSNIGSLTRATLLQSFSDVRSRIPNTSTLDSGTIIGGLQVIDGQLIGTLYEFYDGNVSAVTSHFRLSSLNLTSSVQGLFQVGNLGGGFVAGYMAPIPTEWQDLLGAPYLTGQAALNIISRTSSGPAAFGFDPDDLGAVTAPVTPYVYYPLDHQTLGWGTGGFNGTTRIEGVLFAPGSRSILFFGSEGTGTIGYGEASDFNDPYRGGKGYHSQNGQYEYKVWAYDALDFLAAKNGEVQPWNVVPYQEWSFSFPTGVGNYEVGGVAFDPVAGRLYVSQLSADNPGFDRYPLIHVYDVVVPSSGGSSTGAAEIGVVAASDPESGPLTYSITAGNSDGAFTINAATGALTIAGGTSLSTARQLTVRVSDGQFSDTATIIVALNQAPTLNSQTFSVDEDASAGTVVGTLAAADPNPGDRLTYTLGSGNTGEAFALDVRTGAITVVNPAALDPAITFQLNVQVIDAAGLTDQATVTVNVNAVSVPGGSVYGYDNPPPLPASDPATTVNVSSISQLIAAINNLQTGQTISIAAGTYNLAGVTDALYVPQGISNWTIRGATGDRDDVVILGAGMSGSVRFGFWIGNSPGGTIADLTIDGVREHGIIANPGAHNLLVHNVRIVDSGDQFIKSNPSSFGVGNDNGIVEYSVFEYRTTDNNDYTNGVDVHGGDNWIVRYNLFKNFLSPAGQGIAGPAILMWNGSKGSIVEGNTFINVARGISLGLIDNASGNDHQEGVIRNNFFYRDTGLASSVDVPIYVADSPGTQIYHNTVIAQGTYPNAIEYRFASSSGIDIRNNLTDGAIVARDGATATQSGNVTNAALSLFVNPTAGDLHLVSGASVIDQGAALADVTTDIDGQTRDAAPDIGADEFGSATPSDPPPVSGNLLANYSFDEGSGSATGTPTATINGATWTAGHQGTALSFDGSNDYVDLGTLDITPDGSGTVGMTLSAWINVDDVASIGDSRIVSKATSTAEQDHYWMLSTTTVGGQARLRFRLKTGADPNSGTTTLIASSGNLQNNTWYHVAATYDGGTMRLYLNGELVGSTAKTGAAATNGSVGAWIGGNPPSSTSMPWDGKIDEVQLYNRGLTATEIQQLFTGTPSNQPPSIANQTFSVSENAAAGTLIGTVVASDPEGSPLTYAITDGNDSHAFAIDTNTGAITVASGAVLDFEALSTYGLAVQVSDGTQSNAALVTINLTNVNESPVISNQTLSVVENSIVGTAVGTVVASDPDAGTTLNYLITAGNEAEQFTINANTGAISVANGVTLDFEANSSYGLTVQVSDGLLSSTALVTINLTNVNESPTIANQTFTIAENAANGTLVGNVLAADPDAGTTLTYSITAGNLSGAFAINNQTGAITVANGSLLDYEALASYGLAVRVSDGALNQTATATINLTNVNESPTIANQTFSVAENSANGTLVGNVVAGDPDTGTSLTYAITSGNSSGAFAINSLTGAITVANGSLLNYEAQAAYGLTVQVSDGLLTKSAAVTVNLTNVNESPSVANQTFTVAENSAAGTLVGNVVASDPDAGASLSYSIIAGNDAGRFAIDSATGAITVAGAALDFETVPSYGLTVQVSDGLLSSTALVTVNLTNVNESPTIANQTFSVAENVADGTLVGNVVAGDPDAATSLNYSITAGNSSGAFAIDAATGAITVANGALLNYEGQASYSLNVLVSDGALSDAAAVTINITNVNESPAIANQTFTVGENSANGTLVGVVSASDPDAATSLSYSITTGNSSGAFAIDAATGAIAVANGTLLNYEGQASYSLTVQVSDGALGTSAVVTVNLADVNEAPTIGNQLFAVSEGSSVGTVVGTVAAADPDLADTLSFAITHGNSDGAFSIDALTGVITVANPGAVVSTAPPFVLTVEVTDAAGLSQSATATVNVTEVNYAPTISDQSFTVAENSLPGALVGTVTASDPNAGATLTYAIAAGNESGLFAIDAASGAITVADGATLNYEAVDVYDLTVEVNDGEFSDAATVTIHVADVNEAPIAAGQSFSIAENAAAETVVGVVAAVDPDSGAVLTYSITSGNEAGAFAIDSHTGAITVVDGSVLDFETGASYGLTVEISDGLLSDTASVTINLSNVNESPSAADQTFAIAENSASGASVGFVAASDPDGVSTLAYSISGGNASGAFAIDSETGEITVAIGALLNYEIQSSYGLTVQVSDGLLASTALVTVNLTDVNESPSVADQMFSVAENSAFGTAVGAVAASDPDVGNTLSFAITAGNQAGQFTIDSQTGQITVANGATLDFEAASSYALTVQVSDGLLSSTALVTIGLTNVNEAPTLANQTFAIVENSAAGTVVGSVAASDPDAGSTLTYAITAGNQAGQFTISSQTGQISVASGAALDFETVSSYGLSVQVSDGQFSQTAVVTIALTDANEAPLIADQSFTVAENAPSGTLVGSVVADDPDAGSTLTFAITAGNASGAFTIDAQTGAITVANSSALDFESQATYGLTVQVSDGQFNQSAVVTASLTDVLHEPTTLPMSEDFNDGFADSFLVVSGAGSVSGGDYHLLPAAGVDAISTLLVSGALPGDLRLQATINMDAGGGGLLSNGFIIFDYVGPTNFKFAGAYAGSDQWLIGHRDVVGWITDAVVGGVIDPLTDYQLDVVIENDGLVTLSVDGLKQVSHQYSESLTDGAVGLATREASTRFDDFSASEYVPPPPPPSAELPYLEDFEDGAADFLNVNSGTWVVTAGRYEVTPAAGGDGVSTLQLDELPDEFELSAVVNMNDSGSGFFSNSFLIFDYQSRTDFKFAGTYAGSDQWLIGHRNAAGWNTDAVVVGSVDALTDYTLSVTVEQDGTVTLYADGVVRVSHQFTEVLTDGAVGVGTRNAVARFDNFSATEFVPPPPPPGAVVPYQENFEDGVADFFEVQSGTWTVAVGLYRVLPVVGGDGVSLLRLDAIPNELQVSATINMAPAAGGFFSNTFIVFDYQSAFDFKFAGAYAGSDQWVIGHRSTSGWITDAFVNRAIDALTDYDLQLTIDSTGLVMLSVGGVHQLSRQFAESLTDGGVGLGIRNAVGVFDNVFVAQPGGSASQTSTQALYQLSEFDRLSGVITNDLVAREADSPGTEIYDNTVYGDDNDQNAVESRLNSSRGIEVKNNPSDQKIVRRNGVTAEFAGNGTTADASLFVDPSAVNLQRVRGAQVIGQDASLSDGLTDSDSRSHGRSSDVGANEYVNRNSPGTKPAWSSDQLSDASSFTVADWFGEMAIADATISEQGQIAAGKAASLQASTNFDGNYFRDHLPESNNGRTKFYVDNVEGESITFQSSSGVLTLGCHRNRGQRFSGQRDDSGAFDRAFAAGDVMQLGSVDPSDLLYGYHEGYVDVVDALLAELSE
jgi:hypothetical protein